MFARLSRPASAGSRPSSADPRKSTRSTVRSDGTTTLAPLLLHFDVNKTVIQSDSIQMKTIEEGVREGISELFWGYMRKEKDKLVWHWTKSKPSCNPPKELPDNDGTSDLMTYAEYCKKVVKDKADRKEAVKFFKLVSEHEVREEMEKLMHVTVNKMQLPNDIKRSRKALDAGLRGSTLMMFPAIFNFVAVLQRSKRTFGILFRSFGADHDKIKYEWNAFCEMRHPVYSHLIQGLGPLDGSVAGSPDRRIHGIHTLYRDAQGPILLVDTFTNGPQDDPWDAWAREKPKPKADTRGGREFIKTVLKADTVMGIPNIQKWMKAHLLKQATAAIKDDWAWWTWNEENPSTAKLLTLIGGNKETKQLFFDDNIEHTNARIVDCRDPNGNPIPLEQSLNKLITKVNPVEAMLDDEYFLRKLQRCHGEHLDVGASLLEFQRQLTELEEQKESYAKQVQALNMQLRNLTEENRRMKLMRRLQVRDEAQLRDLLAKDDIDLNLFGQDRYKKVSDLLMELDQEHCWLEYDDNGKLIRVLEMLFMKIQYKDFILIESHEQDADGHIQTRNYLPGVNKTLKETSFHPAMERFFEDGLQVNLKNCVKEDMLPIFVPEAPNQVTGCTQAYPIPAKVQQSQAIFVIPDKEVEAHEKLLGKIGLPGGKHFTTREKELHGGTITRFWRWDKVATWEATTSQKTAAGPTIDISQTCDKLFRGHPRREVYENLLLQMFESFTANKLCGGFSGSVVIRVQPFESDGRPGEPCIVKLDAGDAIREEYVNSVNVFAALPDRAARILGEAVYAEKDEEEFGAFRLELAGACWNVPELAQGSANLLSTFKDLLLYESEQVLLGSAASGSATDVSPPFGNVNSVLAETFGPGGVVSSLRKGGNGLRRATTPLLWGHYSLKGKESRCNPYTAKKGEYPPEPAMRRLYKKYFGVEMPDLKELVVGRIKPQLMDLANSASKELYPLVALAHGDLNAANIMIDAYEAVWLIDFATSVELPLFTDVCKFEMACLFEYATIPITPKLLVEFASTNEEMWSSLNIGDWLRVAQDIVVLLLQELVALPPDRLAALMNEDLDKIIEDVAVKSGRAPHKQRGVVRALKARLVTNEAEMDRAFSYCATISNSLLQGTYLGETLDIRSAPPADGLGSNGCASLKYFMDISVTIRRFMVQDIMNCLREHAHNSAADGLQPCDALSLQMWLPFLRESYRVLGYGDICPQQKVWSVFHCSIVAGNVLREIETLRARWRNLRSLPVMDSLQHDLAARKRVTRLSTSEDLDVQKGVFSVADSHWVYAHRDAFPSSPPIGRVVRKMHSLCSIYKDLAGVYSPVFEAFAEDERLMTLEFNSHHASGMELFLDEPDMDGLSDGMKAYGVSIGFVTGSKGSHTVILKSHLFVLTAGLLQHKVQSMSAAEEEPVAVHEGFSLAKWSGGIFLDKTELLEKHRKSKPDVSVSQSLGFEQRNPRRLSLIANIPDEFYRCISVNCVARDAAGKEEVRIRLVLGGPVCCYPCGSKICIDASAVPLDKAAPSPEVVIMSLVEGSGDYRIRYAFEPTQETERDFDPQANNHVMLAPCLYKVGQRILFREDETSWADAEVVEAAVESTGYRHRLQPLSSKPNLAKQFSDVDILGYDSKQEAEQDGQEPAPKLLRHLNVMNSGCHRLPAVVFEDEVHRVKVYCRARHSYIIDALSGMRLDVKECAMPTLHIMSPMSGMGDTKDTKGKARMTRSASATSLASSASASTTASSGSGASLGDAGVSDYRLGWQELTTAVAKFEKAIPTCTPNAFLVLGSPGSGKTCLICRLIMHCLERPTNLVPLQLPVADLVKRTSQDAESSEMDSVAVYTWFDKYLRMTFGEDSNRYRMICQAIRMHRAMFLFEGLDDAGGLAPVIERCIKDFVQDRHFVVVTSRPLKRGSSTMEDMGEYMLTMKLQNVTDEQKRVIAHARLGLEGLGVFDKFFKQLREGYSFGVSEDKEDSGEKDEQDVFGNPMMLSMLICYLKSRQEELDEQRANKDDRKASRRTSLVDTQDEGEGVTLTAVYRVALDVMIQRVQSKQQAARHFKEQRIEACKRILQKMAMEMQVQQKLTIEAKEVEGILDRDLKGEWATLKSAVEAGQAMFLRVAAADGGKSELSFLVKGFQHFFAASEIQHDGGSNLPNLVSLFTELWWAPMLEMLAEASPPRYVRLIENRLQKFEPVKGDSFLHIAARVGHRPVFTYLKLFKDQYQQYLWTRSNDLQTPLHVAAEKGYTHLCALMLEHKALIDSEDADGCLAMHVAMQHGHFPTAKFLLERWVEAHGGSAHKLECSKKRQAETLASRILALPGSQPLSEEEFLEAVNETFVELRFFGKAEKIDKQRELGALLAVFWITADHYEQFVRGQSMDSRLSQGSWAKLQDWTNQTVGLTKNPATVGAMLVFVAIMSLGKVKAFKMTFAPEFDDPGEALAHILQTTPILIPSFSRLDDHLQQMILSAMKAEFNFGQFLQAENLPANLFIVKEILGAGEGSVNILGFFLFRIFSAMCGLLGMKTLKGSVFMTDKMYTNFKVGLDVLQHLMDESAQDVYNRFLAERARAQGLAFNTQDMESRAIVRLACLSRIFDVNGGKEVTDAFNKMEDGERTALARFLNADGITEKPGFLLSFAPQLLENARNSEHAGLVQGMRMLLKVYQQCAQEYAGSDKQVVSVFVDDLANFAKYCNDPEVFAFTKFEIARTSGRNSDSQGTVKISPWQLVMDPHELDRLNEAGETLASELLQSSVREPGFLKRLDQTFPEMRYLSGEVPEVQVVLKQTRGALLSVYWTVTEQAEAFRRGQSSDKKLSDKSWSTIGQWSLCVAEQAVLDATLVAIVVSSLGKVPKFREQLCPGIDDHKQVLRYVMETSQNVLPSFARLEPEYRKLVQQCLTQDFHFEQFLAAENLPANLFVIREILEAAHREDGYSPQLYLDFFLFQVFAELCGSLGNESLEGSVYMTEDRFADFEMGISLIRRIGAEGSRWSPNLLYDAYLAERARALSLSLNEKNPESRAIARLACLARVHDPFAAITVSEAFKALAAKEREALTKYLNVDGIKEKPGFILCDSPAFLENAWANKEVGLLPAMRILLRLYIAAEKEFQGSQRAVITIQLGNLTLFAKEFFGSVAFQDMHFELVKKHGTEALVIPKAWIPVPDPTKLDSLRQEGQRLAGEVLKSKVSEDQFKARFGRIFPELSYFTSSVSMQRDQTHGAMIAVYWLISNNHQAFIRGQPQEDQLSRQSWAWIQEWMSNTVKLSTKEAVDATLTFMAIHALGKIPEFREELSPGFDAHMHDVALAHVLENQPQVVPSFSGLSPKYQKLIVDSLSVDFQFSQFLQAENVPANLVVVKEKLKPHGDDGLAIFGFRIFAQMCGKLGSKSLKGSLFMTESQFQRFRPGLDALQQLRTLDAGAAYNAFLLTRGSKALSKFASPEHQALVRLLCLASAFVYDDGNVVCEAFEILSPQERAALTRWLTADGIVSQPGYVLCEVPQLLHNAKTNGAVGLVNALRMLLVVQERCAEAVGNYRAPPSKVIVHIGELATWAREAREEEFVQAGINLKIESLTEQKVFTVQVLRPTGNREFSAEREGVLDLGRVWPWAWSVGLVVLIVLFLVCLTISFGISMRLDAIRPLSRSLGIPRRFAFMVFSSVSGLSFMIVSGMCCYYFFRRNSCTQTCPAPTVSCTEVGPREPFLARRGYCQLQQIDEEVIQVV